MAKNQQKLSGGIGGDGGGAMVLAGAAVAGSDPPAARTVAAALAGEAALDAQAWRGLYGAAALELAGRRVDGADVLEMLRALGVPDDQASARFDEIKAEVRERLADVRLAQQLDDLDRKREAARAHAADLVQRVPLAIAKLKATLADAQAERKRCVMLWGNAHRAKERLERSVPAFMRPIQDRVTAAAHQARAEIALIRSSIEELSRTEELSKAAAKAIREEVRPDERFRERSAVPPLWHSRGYQLESIAQRVGIVAEPIRHRVARGYEARETINQSRRGIAAIDRGFILEGLPEHHDEVAAEAQRLRTILEGRLAEAERAVVECEAEERRVAEEVANWWAGHFSTVGGKG